MSFRTRFFCMSLSRFAQAGMAALIALVLAGAAKADTIKEFVVSGSAQNATLGSLDSCAARAFCSFSGTMTVDVTSSAAFPDGLVTAYDITFPGLGAFNNCCFFQAGSTVAPVWETDGTNNDFQELGLDFTTPTHITGSLLGFDGGNIIGSAVGSGEEELYRLLSGSITPVPEPSSLAVLGAGLLPVIGVIRRRYLNR